MSVTLIVDEPTLLAIRNALWLTQQTAAVADALLKSQVETALKAANPGEPSAAAPSEST